MKCLDGIGRTMVGATELTKLKTMAAVDVILGIPYVTFAGIAYSCCDERCFDTVFVEVRLGRIDNHYCDCVVIINFLRERILYEDAPLAAGDAMAMVVKK